MNSTFDPLRHISERHINVARAIAAGLQQLRLSAQYAHSSLCHRTTLDTICRPAADSMAIVYPPLFDLCHDLLSQLDRFSTMIRAFEQDEVLAEAEAMKLYTATIQTPLLFAVNAIERFHTTGDSFKDTDVMGAYSHLSMLAFELQHMVLRQCGV